MIDESDIKKFVGIKFEYGKSSFTACDCFGIFLLVLKEFECEKKLYEKIYNIFIQNFYNQILCFEKINQNLLPYKVDANCNSALAVIRVRKRLHCGILFGEKVLHACEKNGVVLTTKNRFFSCGNEIARYDLEKMLNCVVF